MGLRDRALIALMIFSFARVGAVTRLQVGDYQQNGKKFSVGLREKDGKFHELPVHHLAEEYLDAYLKAAGKWPRVRGKGLGRLGVPSRGETLLLPTGQADG